MSASPEPDSQPTSLLSRVPAPLLLLGSMVALQVGSSIATTMFKHTSPAVVVLLRVGFAALILLAIARPKPWRWKRSSLIAVATLGVTLGGMNLFFYEAIRTVPIGVAVTVEFIGPLGVGIAQSRKATDFFCALLAAGGIVLLGWPTSGETGSLLGLFFAFVAGLFWAAYILAGAKVGTLSQDTAGLAVAMAVAALVVLPFSVPSLDSLVSYPVLLLTGLAVAVMAGVIPFTLELSALRKLPTKVFGILLSLEPAVAAIAGFLILSQDLEPRQIAAIVMVSAASILISVTAKAARQVPIQPLE